LNYFGKENSKVFGCGYFSGIIDPHNPDNPMCAVVCGQSSLTSILWINAGGENSPSSSSSLF
jgi:hypothetical protein